MKEMYQPTYTSDQIMALSEQDLLLLTPKQLDVINNWIEFYTIEDDTFKTLH